MLYIYLGASLVHVAILVGDDNVDRVWYVHTLVHHVLTHPVKRKLQTVEGAEEPPETAAGSEIYVVCLMDD